MAIHAVVLAGGSGTRFWPVSRTALPKHLVPLLSDRTLLEETVDRLRGLAPPSRTVVVTAKDQAAEVRRLLPRLKDDAVIAEPRARNTAAAVALAAARIRERDRNAVLVVVSADHAIADARRFRATLKAAATRARDAHTLLLVGVRPDRPATGYGYLDPGRKTASVGRRAIRAVRRFTEKPDLATARRWVRGGRHLWNAGIFAWRADAFLEEVERWLPKLHRALVATGAYAGSPQALGRAYARAPSVSLDVGVLERSERVEMIEATFGWDDLGSFAALARHLHHDRAGNAVHGEALAVESGGNVVVGPDGHLVALLGVDDLAVVVTDDATLVCPLTRAEEVRAVVDRLRRSRRGRRHT